MSGIVRALIFILLLVGLASCSSSRRTTDYSATKKRSDRKERSSPKNDEAHFRETVADVALRYLGKPYRYGGKTPEQGFDCSGFISWAFWKAGMDIRGASHDLAKLGDKKSKSELQKGDLIFFGKGKKIGHVALVLENRGGKLKVIHSTTSSGVRQDEINGSAYWKGKYLFSRDVISVYKQYITGF